MSQHPWAPVPVQHEPNPQGSSSMAVASLLLAMVFCLPLLPVIAIVLAVIVLATSRPGRGMAIAALVIGPIALVPSVLLLTTDFADEFAQGFREGMRGPSGERDASGRITAPSQVGIDNLAVGDCVLEMEMVEDLEPGEVPLGEVTAVPCDQQHRSEVFEIYPLDPDDFTSQRRLDRAALNGCLPSFKEYVGVSYRRSTLGISFYSPELGRTMFVDNSVICLASTLEGLTPTMLAGSNR